jgi:Skp family chaperone for outer membrane proteins
MNFIKHRNSLFLKGGDMKYLSGIIITIFALFSFQQGVIAAEPVKIGIFDLQRCLTESNEGKRLQERLLNKQRRMQEKFDKKQNEYVPLYLSGVLISHT